MNRRTNVVLDEDLVEGDLEITGLKSRRALIDYALREFLRREFETSFTSWFISGHLFSFP